MARVPPCPATAPHAPCPSQPLAASASSVRCQRWRSAAAALQRPPAPCTGDGRCPICDSFVRPHAQVRVCDECNYGSFANRCCVCGLPGVADAYYCKECVQQEKDVSFAMKQTRAQHCTASPSPLRSGTAARTSSTLALRAPTGTTTRRSTASRSGEGLGEGHATGWGMPHKQHRGSRWGAGLPGAFRRSSSLRRAWGTVCASSPHCRGTPGIQCTCAWLPRH